MNKDNDLDKNTENKLGNTLDHYNDTITINAVGKLVSKSKLHEEVAATKDNKEDTDDMPNTQDGFVSGFDKDEEELPKPINKPNPDYKNSTRLNAQKREVEYPEGYELPKYTPSSRCTTSVNKTIKDSSSYTPLSSIGTDPEIHPTSKAKLLKVMAFSTFFVFLGILASLVYRVNGLTRHMEYMQASETSIEESLFDVESFAEQKEELVQQVIALETKVEDLHQYVQGNNGSQSNGSLVTEVEPESIGGQNQILAENRVHTVQAGENLSIISERFYGTRNDFQRIIDANNLQTYDLYLGQALIIP